MKYCAYCGRSTLGRWWVLFDKKTHYLCIEHKWVPISWIKGKKERLKKYRAYWGARW